KIVQLEMPEGLIIKDKQPGIIYGVYRTAKDDAVEKGYGKCNLIKGQYYYFSIRNNKSGQPLQKGDLLYTMMEKTNIYYGRITQLAGHFIRLQNVYGDPFYDRYTLFSKWTANDEQKLIDSVIMDIKFTGNYFINNDPSMNVIINGGDYKGKKVLDVMTQCGPADIENFIDYMIARPRLYAGKEWKISEIFATWLSEGAPTVIKNK
ncbi:MAG: hypothetical protein WBO38_14925, partial [Chitinophagaceae bacterium]